MRVFVRSSLLALSALGVVAISTLAQTPPAAKTATPARPANLQQVLATVNGEAITKSDLLDLIMRYNLPIAGNEAQIYSDGIETLINTRLINQFLARQQLPVSQEKIEEDIKDLEKELKNNGRSLAQALDESGKTIEDVKKELAARQRWVDYVKLKGTDAALQKFVDANKDMFNGTMVKASHILLKMDPKATSAEEEKLKQRLVQIKRDIEANKYTFAQAANKFSEDPNKTEGDGGEIPSYFGKNGEIIEEFADAAFALKKGQISEPVRTFFGYHLIQVTDRKPGQPFDLAAQKNLALNAFASDLQKHILEAEKKAAKVDIKPMPADLFPPTPVTGTTKEATPKK